MTSVDVDTLSAGERYRFVTGCITPRPIALVSSLSPDGRTNLAPFSFFNAMGCDPVVFVFSPITRMIEGEEVLPDTLRNVLPVEDGGTGEMVIHLAVESNLRGVSASAEELEYGESEIPRAGFTTAPSLKVRPPRIVESPVAFECRTLQVIRTNPGHALSGNLVVAQAVHAWVDEGLLDSRFRVDQDALGTVGRVGGPDYVGTRDRFSLPRGPAALTHPLPFDEA